MSRLSFLINREDKRLSNSVVDILNMLEMGESVDMIASDMNSKTTNIRRIIRENDIGQDTISTTLQWRKAIKKLLPDREANVIRWNESKESAIPYKLCVPKHFLNADDVEYFPIHDEKAVAMAFATRIRNKMNDKKPA